MSIPTDSNYQSKQFKKYSTLVDNQIVTKEETIERKNRDENKVVSYFRTDRQGNKTYINEDQYKALTSKQKKLIH